MSKDILIHNIKTLRKAYNETIEDLAYAIGMKSASTVSQYETGARTPQRDTIEKIAKHYSVTVDQLINVELSSVGDPILDEKKIKYIYNAIFPMVSTSEALGNKKFYKAYSIHLKLIDQLWDGFKYNELDYKICEQNYFDSLEEGVEESLVNIIWWWMQNSFSANNSVAFEKGKDLKIKDIIGNKAFLKDYYLFDDEDEKIKPEYTSNSTIDDGTDTALMDLIVLLKETEKYMDLADYLMAIKYTYCVMDNGYSKEINKVIGNEMLRVLLKFENKYAIKYFQSIKSIFS